MNIFKQNTVRKLLYWFFNLLGPNINAQVIITHILVGKSQFCKLISGFFGPLFTANVFEALHEEETIVWNWGILVLHILIYLTLLIIVDSGLLTCACSCFHRSIFDENALDDDVLAERHRVLQLNPAPSKHSDIAAETGDDAQENDHLIVQDLTKQYCGRHWPAVNHLTFGAKRGEAFGLLGYNVSYMSLSLSHSFDVFVGSD